jgi:uncharacterized protein
MEFDLYDIIHTKAKTYATLNDPSHDFQHVIRVLNNAKFIQSHEGGDLDIIVPAVYFHDCINYPKTDPRSKNATAESAATAERELRSIESYPQDKIDAVKTAILEHSFSAGLPASSLESAIMQDADRLEATGTIAIMRVFASTGQFERPFYHVDDPFATNRLVEPLSYAIDTFFKRLLLVGDMMNTPTGREMAKPRTEFLKEFLCQFAYEINIKAPF